MLDQYSISDDIHRNHMDLMREYYRRTQEELEDALVTACSCAAAGVPMSDIFVQQYTESSFMTPLQQVTLIGFDPTTPVKTRSTIYRLV